MPPNKVNLTKEIKNYMLYWKHTLVTCIYIYIDEPRWQLIVSSCHPLSFA